MTETRMFFIVKGDDHVALREAHRRGIAIEIDGINLAGTETYCYAPMMDRPKIIDWYSKDAGIAKQAEEGSCLWYTTKED